jgi:CheY-like chemotaxis protein
MGYRAEVAGNGLEALNAVTRQPYDVLLMDVQMPEMDGLEATTRIREQEKATEGHIPIIALTAHAMKEDREICLNAGMDGYITKPLRAEDLLAAIEKLFPHPSQTKTAARERSAAHEEVFDREKLMTTVDGDLELFREIVELFLADCPKALEEIASAISAEDAARLDRAAHALKGSVGNFGARNGYELALQLEMMGKNDTLIGAEDIYATLADEMNRLRLALEDSGG